VRTIDTTHTTHTKRRPTASAEVELNETENREEVK
jgi:hypothetical protein